jgi:hypothetical protein
MESTWAHWTVADKTELPEFLQDHILEGGDGVNFKTVTWTAAAKVVDENWTKVSGELSLTYLPFYSLLSLSLSIHYSLIPSTFTGK